MEINFGSGIGANFGIGREMTGDGAVQAAGQEKSGGTGKANLTIGRDSAAIALSEPVLDVPDAELSRTDRLGELVKAAFSLPPPPMPEFC